VRGTDDADAVGGGNPSLPAGVRVADGVLWQFVEGRVILTALGTDQYFALDEVASRIWEILLDQPVLSAALEQLETVFDVESSTLHHDVAEFVREMTQAGLLCPDP
jgi:hypothetical protein